MNRSVTRARAALGWAIALGLAAGGLGATPAAAVSDGAPPVSELRWTGEAGGDLGYGASRASCDVNGDGFADTVVGDWWWKRGNTANAGAAYVLLGGQDPAGGPIGTGSAVGAVRIDGPNIPNAFAGMSVSCMGDVNGDGLDDVIVGSNRTQRTWVVLGAADFEPVDVATLGTRGFEVTNSAAVAENAAPGGAANFGFWVTGLGDVNGDGLADFAITDNLYSKPANPETGAPAAAKVGRVWVIAGSEDVRTIDVASAAGAARVLFTIDGAGGQITSAENVGDVNGDGLADVVVGSYGATPWGAGTAVPGAAYAVFGSQTPQSVDVSALGEHGFTVTGPQRGRDRLGTSIAALGDINGDGKADFIVGGDGVTNAATGPRSGGAAVVLGSDATGTVFTRPGAAANAVYECADAEPRTNGVCSDGETPRGYWIDGAAADDKLGWASAGVGDVNGDGLPDTVLGAWGHDSGGANAGAVYVVYARPGFSGTVATAALSAADGFRIDGAGAGAQLGRSVGGIGDFDGNGVPDLVGGANGTDYASVYLLGAAKTALALTAGELSVGAGGTLTATVTASRASAGSPSGVVAFTQGGAAVPGCAAVPVVEGSAVCAPSEFPAGGAQTFGAEFSGESGSFAASSAELVAEVARLSSTTRVGGDTSGFAQDELEFTATVPGDASGEVTFFAGDEELGAAPVQSGVATLAYASPVATTFQLTARYAGDARTAPSTSKPRRVTIGLIPVTLGSVTVDAAKVSYGVRPSASVRVTGAKTGTVLFTAGSRELGTARVSGGQATLRLPVLNVGSYRVAAEYIGDETHADTPKRVSVRALSVVQATVSSARVSTTQAKYGSRPSVTVKLGKLSNGAYPTGSLRVSFGSAKQTVTLRADHRGVITVKAPRALTGNVKVTASYPGSKNIAATQASATQKVAKKPAAKPKK
ncbi:Ig-like domain repeat protein [Leucobacter chromiireducens]|uniref:Ig-like domain repeat protein n=1 Tax=Leucobacter chromiireducens TaxID=283877 RepID=UPI000F63EB79|nr:Ig-like domain repeat protein [Leucobacter chromiireducens]